MASSSSFLMAGDQTVHPSYAWKYHTGIILFQGAEPSISIGLVFFFPEQIICLCPLGFIWQMFWSMALHPSCSPLESQTSAEAGPQNCNTAEMVLTWNCL